MGVASSHDHFYPLVIGSLDIQFNIAAKRKPMTFKSFVTVVSYHRN